MLKCNRIKKSDEENKQLKKKKRISVLVLAMLSLGLTNISYAEDVTELLKIPDELVSDLTQEDLEKAVGADGLGERKQEVEYGPVAPFGFKQRASFENVNAYILKNKFSNPPIVRDSRYGSTYVSNYKHNRPIGVVVHETANPGSTIEGEVNFMFNNQHNAFVHAFTDNRKEHQQNILRGELDQKLIHITCILN